jgi:hypothetical protein
MLGHSWKVLLLAFIVLSVGGCASSTQLVNTWQDPKFTGPRLTSIMVIDVTKQASIRRTFEDELVRQLQAHGVQAVQSYTLIPEDGEVPKDRLAQAVAQAGVQGALITRLVQIRQQTQVYPGTYTPPPYMFYGYYSSSWIGFYDPPQIYTYDVVTAETNLFDAKGETLIWSGTTETFSPRDIKKDIQEFAAVIIKSLAASGLI